MVSSPLEAALVHLLQKKWRAVPIAAVKIELSSLTFENLHSSAKAILETYAPPPRLDFDHYFMKLALVIAERRTCPKRAVGAVTTLNDRFVSSGYNGKASKTTDCILVPCQGAFYPAGSNMGLCQATHAELNALSRVRVGEADTLYVTIQPCRECSTAILPYDLKRVVYLESYPDDRGIDLLREAGVEVVKFEPLYYIF